MKVERLPKQVERLLGTGKPTCPKYHGDGVRLFSVGFRACECVAGGKKAA